MNALGELVLSRLPTLLILSSGKCCLEGLKNARTPASASGIAGKHLDLGKAQAKGYESANWAT